MDQFINDRFLFPRFDPFYFTISARNWSKCDQRINAIDVSDSIRRTMFRVSIQRLERVLFVYVVASILITIFTTIQRLKVKITVIDGLVLMTH